MKDIDKIKEKVRKLLDHAADREGTPEGDSFYAKAFEYMAAYGFEERDLAKPDADDEVEHRSVEFVGAYTDKQAALLLALAAALHCTGFMMRTPNTTRAVSAVIFGARRHLDRVEMLYALLNPVMLAGARAHSSQGWHDTSTVVKRRSFMSGFAASVADKLGSAESKVARGDGRYALALVSDQRRAEEAQRAYVEAEGLVSRSSRSRGAFDGGAFNLGFRAGQNTDLGQTRVRQRPALPW
ncbi:DUF2786 domain-containing protein [Corynebacterium auris]|uniref:DUF2786 domain-containing protein n=1 Tax=Corynebacterium auris TaxID=44750 RepID=UPI0025B3FE78|nr:DUF2786 domain-containing protein [Corynebacterium auris]WJY67338.1 hypothetical protein CAURIS_02065 [Corynebacterium auris]